MSLRHFAPRQHAVRGLAVSLAALLLIAATTANAAITHRYTFNDGTANDSVGTAHGTFQNGPTVTFDGQVALDGANDYVSLPGPAIAVNGYSAITLEAWFTINAAPAWQRLWDFGATDAGTNLGYNYIFYSPSSGATPADNRAVISDTNPGYNSEELASAGSPLATGIEHHVAVTIANGGSMTVYRNGVQTGTVALTKSLATVDNALALLGESTYPGDANLNGRIDEFRIYNTALSATEVLNSYNAGQTFKPTLVLDVNPTTGATQLRNATAAALTIDNYQITSAAGALSTAGWSSLSDQNINTIGPGAGQSWDEAGGISANTLSEIFLLGSTTIAPGGTLSLGNAFNTGVGAQDLRFQFSMPDGAIARSSVNYSVAPAIDADFNNNGIVDGADFLIWQRNLGVLAGATNAQGDTDGNGAVNAADLANFKAHFGQPSATASAAAVPEPAAAALALCGLAAVLSRVRSRQRQG